MYETIFRIKLLASLIPSRLIIPEFVQPYFRWSRLMKYFDRFHYDSSLDQGGGQRKQAIRWEQSWRNSSEWAARSLEPLPWNSESRRLALPWYGIRCIETVTIMVAWSIWARERKEYLALLETPTSLQTTECYDSIQGQVPNFLPIRSLPNSSYDSRLPQASPT